MSRLIFSTGQLNQGGICHAISCQWIKKSREKDVLKLDDLGLLEKLAVNWEFAKKWQEINKNYHLDSTNEIVFKDGSYREDIARECTKHNRYALIIFWRVSIDVVKQSKEYEGHTVAIRCEDKKYQYFDPNIGAIEFNNSLEMYEWFKYDMSTDNPFVKYRALLNGLCEIVVV